MRGFVTGEDPSAPQVAKATSAAYRTGRDNPAFRPTPGSPMR